MVFSFVPFAVIINPISVVLSCVSLLNRCWKPKEAALDIDDIETPILRFPENYTTP